MPHGPIPIPDPRAAARPLLWQQAGGAAGGGEDAGPLGDLPLWDFSGLYADPAEPKIDADLQAAEAEVKAFAAAHEGKLAEHSAAEMLAALKSYEAIYDKIGRAISYVGLRYQQNSADPERGKALGDAQARITDITAPLVFFDLEINRIDDAVLEAKFSADPALARYRPFFDQIRAGRPHQLSDELEKFLHDQSVVGASAWNRLFDETMSSLEIPIGDEVLALEPALTRLTDADREKRAAAAKALGETFEKNIRLFARITNTLAKEKEISDRWRKLPTPEHGRHLSNQVEPEVVEALRDAVTQAYPRLSHRYYTLKAGWLGLDRLQTWDRNAPLPQADERPIPWFDARDMVLSAYGEFAPEMADIAGRFFDENWIDAAVRPGKSPGAFAHPTVTSAHPFVMLNYLGKSRDVMTLAHELG
ncbi:MAG: M3 family metallopeptidase, partial [Pseudomonadota bacterium]